MPARLLIRRRALRVLAPVSLVAAIASYATLLFYAHEATKRATVTERYVQRLGSTAARESNAFESLREGTVVIGRRVGAEADATWQLGPYDEPLSRGMPLLSERIFVAGLGVALYRSDSSVTVSVDGRAVSVLHPDLRIVNQSGGYAAADPPLEPLNVPPAPEIALTFAIRPDGTCVSRPCLVRLHTDRARWIVRRVGVLFTTETSRAPIWTTSLGLWAILVAAAALAALSHVALSMRSRRARAARSVEWKPT